MTAKARVKQLEKQAAQNNSASPLESWRDFVDWCNGELTFDANTEAKLQKEFDDFIAKNKAEDEAINTL